MTTPAWIGGTRPANAAWYERGERPGVSLAWILYTYALLASLTFWIVAIVASNLKTFGPEHTTLFLLIFFVFVPLAWLVISLGIGVYDAFWGGGSLVATTLWALALPARGWAWTWMTLLRIVFRKFLWAVAIGALLAVVGAIAGIMISAGVNGWLVLLLCVIGLGTTIGGVRWANQYGSGITGGISIATIALIILIFIGIFAWALALFIALAALAVPALTAWMLVGVTGAPDWLTLTVVGVVVAGLCVPLALQRFVPTSRW